MREIPDQNEVLPVVLERIQDYCVEMKKVLEKKEVGIKELCLQLKFIREVLDLSKDIEDLLFIDEDPVLEVQQSN